MSQNAVKAIFAMQFPSEVTLIGDDDQVDQNDYGPSVAIDLSAPHSGEILSILLISDETGTGALLEQDGELLFFDADPSITNGATTLTTAATAAIIGRVSVAAADWLATSASESIAFYNLQPIVFPEIKTLYAVFKNTGATSYNSAAGDQESLRLKIGLRFDR